MAGGLDIARTHFFALAFLMGKTGFQLIIGALVVVVILLGVYIYREESKPGIEIKANQDGLSINKN